MQVPLLDLKAQYAGLRDELVTRIVSVLDSQKYINGPEVTELETKLAAYCRSTSAIGVASGTDALLCTMMALEIGSGDEVITTPYTFFATAGSIWRVGAKPVFVDIDPVTFNIDPKKIEAAVTPRTRAIMPVHLFGQMADMDPIMDIARRHKLHVIEDACQAIGATYKGRPAGSVGTSGCFSFYPSKNLNGIGDGGIITTQDAKFADRLKAFRNHGQSGTYVHPWVGGNFRLDTLQAAALVVKLPHLDGWSDKRRKNAARYNELFKGCKAVTTPVIAPENVSVFNQYVIRVPKRDALKQALAEAGIGTAVYYPLSLHQQDCFASLGHKQGDFPESERAAAETLALPIFAELTEEQIVFVADKVKAFYRS